MRRVDDVDRDRGGATIFMIIAMPVILVGVALAIDVGRYVVEARSAQNSADATALAVATDCVISGGPTADYSPYRKSGQTISSPACNDGEAPITVSTDVDGTFLAQSVGSVDRSATAAWGTLGQAATLPITIAQCEWDKFPVDGQADIVIHLPDTPKATGCASGPGGFGQLAPDGGDPCTVTVEVPGSAPGQPGNSFVKELSCFADALGKPVLIPIFDQEQCPPTANSGLRCQGNDTYPVIGFAQFELKGYSLQQGSGGDAPECDNTIGKNCIFGDFVKFTTSQGTPGPSPDFGAYRVYLIK